MNAKDFPREVDLAIHARWIVPVEPAGALEHHALVVDRGRIVAIAPSASVAASWAPRETVELPTHVLLPGLVNAHAHSAMALLRGVADDLPLKAWLEDRVWPREGRHVSPEFVRDGTLVAEHGATTERIASRWPRELVPVAVSSVGAAVETVLFGNGTVLRRAP